MEQKEEEKLHVKPSSEHGALLSKLAIMIARYTNAHIHFDLKDIPEAEKMAEITQLKDWMDELLH